MCFREILFSEVIHQDQSGKSRFCISKKSGKSPEFFGVKRVETLLGPQILQPCFSQNGHNSQNV